MAANSPAPKKTIVVSGETGAGQQFVVTQSKGTTIIQPTGGGSAQQYIVTAVANTNANSGSTSGDHNSTGQTVYPVQYVEGVNRATPSQEQVVYTNGQNNIAYPENKIYTEYNQSGYSPTNTYSYSGHQVAQMGIQNFQGQMVHQVGGQPTYLIQGNTVDGDVYPLTQTTRAAPATVSFDNRTVQWLLTNFENCDGTSLPRCTLYNFYLHHCNAEKIEPSNPASFGKLVRTIFRDLKTRRLGQRGNSKYHYYGIRIKADSPLNQLVPDDTPVAMRQATHPHRRISKPNAAEGTEGGTKSDNGAVSDSSQHKLYLGSPDEPIPQNDLAIDAKSLPAGITMHDVNNFEMMYKEHCEAVLELVMNLHLNLIENLWQTFWRKTGVSVDSGIEAKLPKEKLIKLAALSEVQEFVKEADYSFYQALVEVLVPDVLRPIPSSLTQTVRNFAKGLESSLRSAVGGVSEAMINVKIAAVSAFSQTLRRYTSLNHLAQAARAVLQNSSQITQMLSDLNRVDFANVQEQASWVCQCEDSLVTQLEKDFKRFLQDQHSLEEWSTWLQSVVDEVLKPYQQTDNFTKAARQFLLKWSFYSSMIIRDLTLRSAASFGSFHLIRLLYDEYIFYLVEQKVAGATGQTTIAVMGELMEMADQTLNTDHMYGVKSTMSKIRSAPMTVVTSEGDTPGSKNVIVVPSAAAAGGDATPAKRQKTAVMSK
ncbi:transcription factor RFX3-like [Watersipora subatra]|uniref:transcription factor RFX3-like n=1 Tax=Watersipora subatra TaxID=2589382 RepID=UPI00355C9609